MSPARSRRCCSIAAIRCRASRAYRSSPAPPVWSRISWKSNCAQSDSSFPRMPPSLFPTTARLRKISSPKRAEMTGVLDGVRVLELTTMITGPLAGMLLADLGAAVIKVENREGGDPFRYFRGDLYGSHFISYNRNKRSLTLDLRAAKGKEILFELVRRSDVLIDNFRPGVLDRLGFSDVVL